MKTPKERSPVIAFRKEKCVNCHQCIAVCPVKMCNNGAGDAIEFNPALCIGCGACVNACGHQARVALDDFEAFLTAIESGECMTAIVAPSAASSFRGSYLRLNGFLKSLGIKAVFDVSFGAELAVKSYLDYIEWENPAAVIAQPCAAIVNFIEIYRPELLPYLAPVDSPMLHTIKMIRKFYPKFRDCRIAALSPCLAKRQEFAETGANALNVTYASINAYLSRTGARILDFPEEPFDNPPPGRAVLFSSPGGLLRTMERYDPDIRSRTRKIEGRQEVCGYLSQLSQTLSRGEAPKYRLVDCLLCKNGCNGGPGTETRAVPIDDLESEVEKRAGEQCAVYGTFGKSMRDAATECRVLDEILASYWEPGLYRRAYTDRSGLYTAAIRIPSHSEIVRIYRNMHKHGSADILNCGSCGYESCEQMAIAIYNGLNKSENCRHYMQIELQNTNETLEEKVKGRTRELTEQIAIAERAKKEADAASRVKSQFLATMSHEIRTPMNAIIGMTDIMPTDNFSELQKRYFEDMRQMSKSLLSIINGILDFSKIEAGKMELFPAHFDVRALFDNITSMAAFLASGKSLQFNASLGALPAPALYADETRLRQIITNIVNNAVKYTREGSVEFSLREEKRDDALYLIVSVKDTGIGIRREDMPKLFGVFRQLDAGHNRGVTGTGLGLAITRRLVRLMGGDITAESEYGKGSVFTVTVPVQPGDPAETERDPDAGASVMVKPGSSVRALVVDDTPINLTVALGHLARHGITADTAQSGKEALEKIFPPPAPDGAGLLARAGILRVPAPVRPAYSIVFMDHMMPDMDGVETARRIRLRGASGLPIIALTANAIAGMREMFLEHGMNDFIAKPIMPAELNRVLAAWLPKDKIITVNAEQPAARESARGAALLAPAAQLINTKAALTHIGDAEAVAAYIRQFCRDFDGYAETLGAALGAGDAAAYRIKIHAVKGIVAALGREDLAAEARALEEAAKAGDTAACRAGHGAHLARLAAFRDALAAAFPPAAREEAAARRISAADFTASLSEVYGAAFNSRNAAALTALEAVEGAGVEGMNAAEADAARSALAEIRALLERFQNKAAAEAARSLLDALEKTAR